MNLIRFPPIIMHVLHTSMAINLVHEYLVSQDGPPLEKIQLNIAFTGTEKSIGKIGA